MNLHLHKNDILRLICDKYSIAYDLLKDVNGFVVDVVIKEPGIFVTWERSNYEIETKKETL